MGKIRAVALAVAAGAALGLSATPASAVPAAPGGTVTRTLTQAIADLPVADESRAGYERTKFRHWVDADRNRCNTRAEVLLEEAIVLPTVGSGCRLSGGEWDSWYDGRTIDGPEGWTSTTRSRWPKRGIAAPRRGLRRSGRTTPTT